MKRDISTITEKEALRVVKMVYGKDLDNNKIVIDDGPVYTKIISQVNGCVGYISLADDTFEAWIEGNGGYFQIYNVDKKTYNYLARKFKIKL